MSDENKTGPEIVYELLETQSVDSVSALKGALRYFANSEGREVADVQVELIRFTKDDDDGEERITIRAILVP